MHLAAVGGIVHVREAHAPFAVLAEFFRMVVPDIAVEGDLQERHGEDFGGLGIRPVDLSTEPDGDLIDQECMEEHIRHASNEDRREAPPREDLASGGAVGNRSRFRCRWGEFGFL